MAVIGKVSAIFTSNSSGLVSGVNRSASSMRKMESSVSSLRSQMRTLVAIQGAQFFGSVAAGAGYYARELLRLGQAQADAIDKQSKLAARLGMTYGEFSGLALAGELAGVGMNTVAMAATKADVAFVNAVNGSATARRAFDTLGLSLDQLGQMSAAERFRAIAAAIAALPTEAQRSAVAVQLFGRAGAQLLPMFQDGAAGIDAAAEQAERLGLALTSAQGRDVEAMNDAFTLASQAIKGIIGQVTAYLAPAIQSVSDTFTNMVGSVGGANIGKAIGDGILSGARFLAGIGDWFISNLGSVFAFFSSVGGQWGAMMDFANRVAQAFYGAFKLFEAVGNTIGGAISQVIAWLLNGVAKAAAMIPGFGKYAEDLRSGADAMASSADNYMNSANANFDAAGAAFTNAFSAETAPIGQAMAGPLVTALDAARLAAEASAAQIEESGSGAASQVLEAAAVAAEPKALKAVDSRSSEGIAEMFRLMRGGDNIQERMLAVQEEIAANTAVGDDALAVEF